MKRILIILFVGFALMFTACEGDKGNPGPQGEQGIAGENGSDGSDGADGADGKDGNTKDFYFQNGFKGYSGMVDASIYNSSVTFGSTPPPTPDGERLYFITQENTTDPLLTDSVTLVLRFDGLAETVEEEIGESLCSGEYFINDATLYLSGVYAPISTSGTFMQVGIYGSDTPLFVEGEANWANAGNSTPWAIPGGGAEWVYNDPYIQDILGGTPGYFIEMNPNPAGTIFTHEPMFIPRETIKTWLCEEGANKGLRLAIYGEGQAIVHSSEVNEVSLRPMLYINIDREDDTARKEQLSDQEAFNQWKAKTYEEKMAPYYKLYPNQRP